MVYVPILKIDLPEPRLQELLPGLVTAVLGCCTFVFDTVHDYLRPLSPEAQVVLYEQVIEHLPKEFRKVRKRIVELDIQDEDRISDELEDAGYAFYRRKIREDVCGYSDEDTEDVTFRRLMSPESATRAAFGITPLDQQLAMEQQLIQQLEQEQQQQAGTSGRQAASIAVLPSRARRVTVTSAASGAGLALGMGLVKVVQLVSKRLHKGKKKPRRGVPQQPGSRRQSEQGGAAGTRGSRRGSSSGVAPRGSAGRTTPRQTK